MKKALIFAVCWAILGGGCSPQLEGMDDHVHPEPVAVYSPMAVKKRLEEPRKRLPDMSGWDTDLED